MDKPHGGGGGGVLPFFFIHRLRPSIYRWNPMGGYSHFSSYIGSGPASTVHQKKTYQEFQVPQIDIWSFSNPKNILHSVPWPSEKTLKCIEMTSNYSPILWWPQKISTESSYPQKYSVFWKTLKNIEIQNFEPKKIARAYVCMKI